MLHSLPEETTQLLIDLCTTTGPLVPDEAEPPIAISSTTKPAAPAPSYLSYLALNRGVTVPTTVSSETATPPSPSIKTVRPDNGSTRREPSIITQDVGGATASGSRSSTPPATASSIIANRTSMIQPGTPPRAAVVRKISPRIYFPHFVDHMEQFVIFLETVAMRRWGQGVEDLAPGTIGLLSSDGQASPVTNEDEQGVLLDKMDQVAVWNTLLELYLTLPLRGGAVPEKEKEGDAREQETLKKKVYEQTMREKAMRVLKSDVIPYDPMHALILCSTHGFTLGLVLLWEKKGMYEDVLRFWMDKDREGNTPGASQKVIEHLMQYGHEHPHLYQLVLRFLSSTPELLKRHQDDLKEVVEYIDEEGIMPPLGIIQVLSRNEVASVGLVKEWLIKRITVSQTKIQNVGCPFILVHA
jgi:vacuolar protein sorting-associated protein 11